MRGQGKGDRIITHAEIVQDQMAEGVKSRRSKGMEASQRLEVEAFERLSDLEQETFREKFSETIDLKYVYNIFLFCQDIQRDLSPREHLSRSIRKELQNKYGVTLFKDVNLKNPVLLMPTEYAQKQVKAGIREGKDVDQCRKHEIEVIATKSSNALLGSAAYLLVNYMLTKATVSSKSISHTEKTEFKSIFEQENRESMELINNLVDYYTESKSAHSNAYSSSAATLTRESSSVNKTHVVDEYWGELVGQLTKKSAKLAKEFGDDEALTGVEFLESKIELLESKHALDVELHKLHLLQMNKNSLDQGIRNFAQQNIGSSRESPLKTEQEGVVRKINEAEAKVAAAESRAAAAESRVAAAKSRVVAAEAARVAAEAQAKVAAASAKPVAKPAEEEAARVAAEEEAARVAAEAEAAEEEAARVAAAEADRAAQEEAARVAAEAAAPAAPATLVAAVPAMPAAAEAARVAEEAAAEVARVAAQEEADRAAAAAEAARVAAAEAARVAAEEAATVAAKAAREAVEAAEAARAAAEAEAAKVAAAEADLNVLSRVVKEELGYIAKEVELAEEARRLALEAEKNGKLEVAKKQAGEAEEAAKRAAVRYSAIINITKTETETALTKNPFMYAISEAKEKLEVVNAAAKAAREAAEEAAARVAAEAEEARAAEVARVAVARAGERKILYTEKINKLFAKDEKMGRIAVNVLDNLWPRGQDLDKDYMRYLDKLFEYSSGYKVPAIYIEGVEEVVREAEKREAEGKWGFPIVDNLMSLMSNEPEENINNDKLKITAAYDKAKAAMDAEATRIQAVVRGRQARKVAEAARVAAAAKAEEAARVEAATRIQAGAHGKTARVALNSARTAATTLQAGERGRQARKVAKAARAEAARVAAAAKAAAAKAEEAARVEAATRIQAGAHGKTARVALNSARTAATTLQAGARGKTARVALAAAQEAARAAAEEAARAAEAAKAARVAAEEEAARVAAAAAEAAAEEAARAAEAARAEAEAAKVAAAEAAKAEAEAAARAEAEAAARAAEAVSRIAEEARVAEIKNLHAQRDVLLIKKAGLKSIIVYIEEYEEEIESHKDNLQKAEVLTVAVNEKIKKKCKETGITADIMVSIDTVQKVKEFLKAESATIDTGLRSTSDGLNMPKDGNFLSCVEYIIFKQASVVPFLDPEVKELLQDAVKKLYLLNTTKPLAEVRGVKSIARLNQFAAKMHVDLRIDDKRKTELMKDKGSKKERLAELSNNPQSRPNEAGFTAREIKNLEFYLSELEVKLQEPVKGPKTALDFGKDKYIRERETALAEVLSSEAKEAKRQKLFTIKEDEITLEEEDEITLEASDLEMIHYFLEQNYDGKLLSEIEEELKLKGVPKFLRGKSYGEEIGRDFIGLNSDSIERVIYDYKNDRESQLLSLTKKILENDKEAEEPKNDNIEAARAAAKEAMSIIEQEGSDKEYRSLSDEVCSSLINYLDARRTIMTEENIKVLEKALKDGEKIKLLESFTEKAKRLFSKSSKEARNLLIKVQEKINVKIVPSVSEFSNDPMNNLAVILSKESGNYQSELDRRVYKYVSAGIAMGILKNVLSTFKSSNSEEAAENLERNLLKQLKDGKSYLERSNPKWRQEEENKQNRNKIEALLTGTKGIVHFIKRKYEKNTDEFKANKITEWLGKQMKDKSQITKILVDEEILNEFFNSMTPEDQKFLSGYEFFDSIHSSDRRDVENAEPVKGKSLQGVVDLINKQIETVMTPGSVDVFTLEDFRTHLDQQSSSSHSRYNLGGHSSVGNINNQSPIQTFKLALKKYLSENEMKTDYTVEQEKTEQKFKSRLKKYLSENENATGKEISEEIIKILTEDGESSSEDASEPGPESKLIIALRNITDEQSLLVLRSLIINEIKEEKGLTEGLTSVSDAIAAAEAARAAEEEAARDNKGGKVIADYAVRAEKENVTNNVVEALTSAEQHMQFTKEKLIKLNSEIAELENVGSGFRKELEKAKSLSADLLLTQSPPSVSKPDLSSSSSGTPTGR